MREEGSVGIYRFYHEEKGVSFVGFSWNLRGTWKRLRFELKANACSYKRLQEFYNACGGDLAYEVLEEIDPSQFASDRELEAYTQARLYHHKSLLRGQMIQTEV